MGFTTRMGGIVSALCVWSIACAQTSGPRVIVVGVDGLSVDGVTVAGTPRIHELMRRGAWSLEARGVMPTLSSPNWESAIGGAPPEFHGITSNGYLRKLVEFEPVCRSSGGKFPTIFGVLRQQQPNSRIAIFHDWKAFRDLVEASVPDVMKHEAGAENTMTAAIQYWRQNLPALMFVHLDNVDHAGHQEGWFSSVYYQAVMEADTQIGRLLNMLDELQAREETFVLVTSDHGGTRHGHGKNSLEEILIPWILSGPGVAPGRLSAYINTYDTAATLAWIFQLDPPQCWTGRPVLAAFSQSAISVRSAARPGHNLCAPRALAIDRVPTKIPPESQERDGIDFSPEH